MMNYKKKEICENTPKVGREIKKNLLRAIKYFFILLVYFCQVSKFINFSKKILIRPYIFLSISFKIGFYKLMLRTANNSNINGKIKHES